MVHDREENEKEWQMYRNKEDKNEEEGQLFQILNRCLMEVENKINRIIENNNNEKQLMVLNERNNIKNLEENLDNIIREFQEERRKNEEIMKQNMDIKNNIGFLENKLF